jgi:hypothetical protein
MSLGTAGVAMYFIAKHFGSIPLLGKLVLGTPGGDESELLVAMDDAAGRGEGGSDRVGP